MENPEYTDDGAPQIHTYNITFIIYYYNSYFFCYALLQYYEHRFGYYGCEQYYTIFSTFLCVVVRNFIYIVKEKDWNDEGCRAL